MWPVRESCLINGPCKGPRIVGHLEMVFNTTASLAAVAVSCGFVIPKPPIFTGSFKCFRAMWVRRAPMIASAARMTASHTLSNIPGGDSCAGMACTSIRPQSKSECPDGQSMCNPVVADPPLGVIDLRAHGRVRHRSVCTLYIESTHLVHQFVCTFVRACSPSNVFPSYQNAKGKENHEYENRIESYSNSFSLS